MEKPLEEDFKLEGRSLTILELSAKEELQVDVEARLLEVDERGGIELIASAKVRDIELSDEPLKLSIATEPVSSRRIESGHILLVEIWLRGETGIYHLHCGCEGTRVEFPGIIVPEKTLPLLSLAPLIPVAVLRVKRRKSKDE